MPFAPLHRELGVSFIIRGHALEIHSMAAAFDAGGLRMEVLTSQVEGLSLKTPGPFGGDCICWG